MSPDSVAAGQGTAAPVAALIGVRLIAGGFLLLAPGLVLKALPGHRRDRATRNVARVLGARHLTEGASLWHRPTSGTARIGAAVDAAHAGSMLLAAIIWPQKRGLALTSAGAAIGLAGAGFAAANSAEAP